MNTPRHNGPSRGGSSIDPITFEVIRHKLEAKGDYQVYLTREGDTFLATYGDDNAYMCPAEASVGVNAKAIVRGIQREDKNIMGTMHFGLGTNVDVGGSIMSKIHMDGVILEPTLYVDGVRRIEHGRFLVPIEG